MFILCAALRKVAPMPSKPNWSCNVCGMYSSRRSSVKRHIVKLHGGSGNSIPFADYVAGIRNGFYPTANRPTFKSTKTSVLEDELGKEIARRSVKKVLDTSPEIVDYLTDSFIPKLLSSPMLQSPSIPGLNIITRIYWGKANVKLSDEIFGLVHTRCEACGLFFESQIKYGDKIQSSGFYHQICKDQPNYVHSIIGSAIDVRDHPFILLLNKIKFRGNILDWTLDNCALLAIKMAKPFNSIVVSMGGSTSTQVKLDLKTESVVTLTELELFSWLSSGINSGWTTMDESDIDEFLSIVPNKTWFFLKLMQEGKVNFYFVMLFYPYVRKRPVVSFQDNN